MARSHLCRILGSGFGTPVSRLGRVRKASSPGAHLWCMNTPRPPPLTSTMTTATSFTAPSRRPLAQGPRCRAAGQRADDLRPAHPGLRPGRLPSRPLPALPPIRDRGLARVSRGGGRSAPGRRSVMAGRPRTVIGTYRTIHVKRVGKRRYRARRRVRYPDGRLREVKVTSSSGNQAKTLLRDRLKVRDGYGASGLLAVSSPFPDLANLWLQELAGRDIANRHQGELPRRRDAVC